MKKTKSRKISLLIVSLIILSLAISLNINFASSTDVLIVDEYNMISSPCTSIRTQHPSSTTDTSAGFQTFKVITDCYVHNITISLKKTGTPSGYLAMRITGATGDYDGNTCVPDDVIYENSLSTVDSAYLSTLNYEDRTFNFSGTNKLIAGTAYAFYYYAVGTGFSQAPLNIAFASAQSRTTSGNTGYYANSTWYPSAASTISFKLYGEVAVPATPTPSPTPAPADLSWGIWATLSPYSTLLLPLIIILIVALICGKFGGVWGFFAGLNVSCIIIYAVMGSVYFPLWGIVLLGIVDGLLLFGKISGRV